jgi:hypothetical protein
MDVKGDDDITRGVYQTIRSRDRDVVVERHIVGMGNRLGWEMGMRRERGGGKGSVYKQPGTRVDMGHTTCKGGIPNK